MKLIVSSLVHPHCTHVQEVVKIKAFSSQTIRGSVCLIKGTESKENMFLLELPL